MTSTIVYVNNANCFLTVGGNNVKSVVTLPNSNGDIQVNFVDSTSGVDVSAPYGIYTIYAMMKDNTYFGMFLVLWKGGDVTVLEASASGMDIEDKGTYVLIQSAATTPSIPAYVSIQRVLTQP